MIRGRKRNGEKCRKFVKKTKKSKLITNPNQNIYERKEINQKLCERGNRNMSSVMTKIVKIDKNHITALLDEFLISEMTVFQVIRRDCKGDSRLVYHIIW